MSTHYELRSTEDVVDALTSEPKILPIDTVSDNEEDIECEQSESNSDDDANEIKFRDFEFEKFDETETRDCEPSKKRRSSTPTEETKLHEESKRKIGPSPIGAAQEVTTPLEAWSLLFTDDILQKIVKHTNREITRDTSESTSDVNADLTIVELKACIGLLYLSGMQKTNNTNLEELWSLEFGPMLYRDTMPLKIFRFWLSMLRFDDHETRNDRRATDKFAPIREIWKTFIENCGKSYEPSNFCTINDQLLSFRGRCPFVIDVPSKTHKRGIKIVMLNDARTFYMINAEPHVGNLMCENAKTIASYYLTKISEPIHGSHRIIGCESYFATVDTISRMQDEFSLKIVGTTRANKRYEGSRVSGGHHGFDRLCREYTTARKTLRWPMRIFYGMLDQASINSFVLYNYNSANTRMDRICYLKTLIMSLLEPQLRSRLEKPQLRRSLRSSIVNILNIVVGQPVKRITSTSRRCCQCPREKDKKTKVSCATCNRPVCEDHRVQLCKNCGSHD